ncbi:MAG: hypothetical protein COW24_05400 [Candidatus Kerfeldbacteria bacterium CG15_BIG_FIL_POST_REV_8_21_14_020_45_12]|uniref:Histidine kinase N-terminal 7TM region domain-containing protein n=1 Tax=Candidatus Kerfeldbacteria bacterium CG15_BIG_FIL_POST_REV_8_21_14_020_45_12 TaxID=2014247 RepID=A0A2M7H2L1_9BACT|nr:MAG: hypothetical protein COW24_05400 [Candidatus Kerfeldbacteria bacterium CG15_BIG_FIL_POST_REV_8_21_14_020_45_12]PJA93400.1 MAG: hypothetical protein CO132_03525 [Candidatus Kerfeldbacteria bacterium CG_4_9_14_3_um_filter_45_8]
MNTLFIATIVSALGNVGLGSYALAKDPQSKTHRFFAAYAFILAVWVAEFYWSIIMPNLWLMRGSIFIAVFEVTALYLFANSFVFEKISRKLEIFLTALCFVVAALTLTPFVFSGSFISGAQLLPSVQWGVVFFALYSIGAVLASWFLFAQCAYKSVGKKRMQCLVLFFGLFFTMGIIVFCNFFSVVLWQTQNFFQLGMISTLLFTSAAFFVMVRYRFMDARMKLTRKVALVGSSALLVTTLLIVIWGAASIGSGDDLNRSIKFVKVILATSIVFDAFVSIWGFAVMRAEPRRRLIFLITFLTIALWEFSMWVDFFVLLEGAAAALSDILTYVLGGLSVVLMLLFVLELTDMWKRYQRVWVPIAVILFLLSIASSIPGVVVSPRVIAGSLPWQIYLTPEPLTYYFYLSLFPPLLFSGFALWKAQSETEGVERTRLRHVSFGVLFATAFALVTNAGIPLVLKYFSFDTALWSSNLFIFQQLVGVIAVSALTFSVAYAMTRYRFFGARFIITRALSYGGVVAGVLIVGVFAVWYISSTVGFNQASSGLLGLAVALLLTIGIFLVNHELRHQIRRLVPEQGYDFSFVEEAPELFDTSTYFTMLRKDISESVVAIIPDATVGLFVYLRPDDRWLPIDKEEWPRLFSDHPMADLVSRMKDAVVADELRDSRWVFENSVNPADATRALKLMEKIGVDIVLPVWWYQEEIRGLIVVKAPKSERRFSLDKIDALKHIAKSFGSKLSIVIAYHYAVKRGERTHVGLDIERKD